MTTPIPSGAPRALLCAALILFATPFAKSAQDDQNTSLPPLVSDDLSARAAQLFEAIKSGKPESADAFFFPREPFLTLKDVADPGRYHAQILAAYHHDIRDLHKSRRSWDGAELRGFELVAKPKRVPPGHEWNKIGYYRTIGARLEYEIQGRRRFIEVHTVISWDGRWYVTHLAPLRH
ncbi:MAG TPA: hypothetical protein VHC69_08690 [Polyangiaceae bacterium]|nr:hypothetical protein [Polyangiaceae bacterium]